MGCVVVMMVRGRKRWVLRERGIVESWGAGEDAVPACSTADYARSCIIALRRYESSKRTKGGMKR